MASGTDGDRILWAPDCATGLTNGMGRCYRLEDFESDNVHPSTVGEQKVALMIHERLLQHGWYRR